MSVKTAHRRHNEQGKRNLDDAVALLPTPAARDHKGLSARKPRTLADGSTSADPCRNNQLPDAINLLPTPRATDGEKGGPNQRGKLGGSDAALRGDAAPDSDRDALRPQPVAIARSRDSTIPEHDVQWAGYRPAIERWEQVLGRPAPAPTVLGKRGGRQLSPLFVEWMMGLPAGWVTDVPGLSRNQMLKLLGNGVVPQQAADALRHLLPLLLKPVAA